ncbi:MAG: complex I NDUFA9 subunit family protein [Rhodothalassiaceae bacterium]
MTDTVTVFGGSGFLGRRIVACLLGLRFCVRAAARHPERITVPAGSQGRLIPVRADVTDADSVARALEGAHGVVNAVSLYRQRGGIRFADIHVAGAEQVARAARSAGVTCLVHLSGIGADANDPAPYLAARGQGQDAVCAAFPNATVFRPSVMMGPGDGFLERLIGMARLAPVMPLFGRGQVRLQPVYVGDVAQAAGRAMSMAEAHEPAYDLGGPEVFAYRDLVARVLRLARRRRPLIPMPALVWRGLAAAGAVLPHPPVTPTEVALMQRDNVTAPYAAGLSALNVAPTPLDQVVRRHIGAG